MLDFQKTHSPFMHGEDAETALTQNLIFQCLMSSFWWLFLQPLNWTTHDFIYCQIIYQILTNLNPNFYIPS